MYYELPCWALVLLTVVAVLGAALVLLVLLRHTKACPQRPSDPAPAPAPAPLGVQGDPEEVDPSLVPQWIAEHPNAALLFYAPWCQHCHAMLPRFREAARARAGRAAAGIVNCDDHPQLVSLYGLRGFPTLLHFRNGDMEKEYQGDRQVPSLRAFLDAI